MLCYAAVVDYSRCFDLYREDRSYRKHMEKEQEKVVALQEQQRSLEADSSSRRMKASSSSPTYTHSQETSDPRPGSSVQQVLSAFVRREELEEYSCPHCSCKKGPGSMRSSLSRLPDVLVLHLQRLTYNGKIRTLVKFPLEGLSMLPYTTGR